MSGVLRMRPGVYGRRLYVLFFLLPVLLLVAGVWAVPVTPAAAEPSSGSTQDSSGDPLEQTVSGDEAVVHEETTVSVGHVDIGPHADATSGEWSVLARDDSGSTPVWRSLDDLVIRVADAALLDAPTGPDYAFMGAQAGDRWYVIPQTQNPAVVWLGWNTQDPGVTSQVDRGVTMRVYPATGPGRAILFLQDGSFGKPLVLADSQAGKPQDAWVDVNTHVHANWVFTQPGVYVVPVDFSAQTRDGGTRQAHAVLRFAVGDATSEDDARKAVAPDVTAMSQETALATAGDGAGDSSQGQAAEEAQGGQQGAQSAADSGVNSVLWWALAAAVLLCVLCVMVWWRSRSSARDIAAAREEVASRGGHGPDAGGQS